MRDGCADCMTCACNGLVIDNRSSQSEDGPRECVTQPNMLTFTCAECVWVISGLWPHSDEYGQCGCATSHSHVHSVDACFSTEISDDDTPAASQESLPAPFPSPSVVDMKVSTHLPSMHPHHHTCVCVHVLPRAAVACLEATCSCFRVELM